MEEEGEGEEGVEGREGDQEGGGERERRGVQSSSLRPPAQNVLNGEYLRLLPPLFTLHACNTIEKIK